MSLNAHIERIAARRLMPWSKGLWRSYIRNDFRTSFGYYRGMKLFHDLVRAVFRNRPNRFIVECAVEGRPVRAYLPNPGRLWELLLPGRTLYLARHGGNREISTEFIVAAVERDGHPVMLHTHLNNAVARLLIEQNRIPGLEGAVVVKPEIAVNGSRFDFLLRKNGRDIYLEVKSCTLVGNSIAMFPDAITDRGTKHLLELSELSRKGADAAVLFIVHWPSAQYFMPEHHTDLEFSQVLLDVKDRVMVRAVAVGWEKDLSLGKHARILDIPWRLVERESHDRGSYIVVLRLTRDRVIGVGSLGRVRFRKGYYLYVGSAMANLTKRIERHRRLVKKFHWHIDCLRQHAEWRAAVPVRTADDIECEVATALRRIAGWTVPGFGCSDCSCDTHLFGMAGDPVHDKAFINLLLDFRINRLEKYLTGLGREVQARREDAAGRG